METKGDEDVRDLGQWSDVIHRDLINLGFGWSIEEAEVAIQDRTVRRILTSQAASADMHDASW